MAPSNWQVAVATTAMLLNDWSRVLQPALAGGLRGLLDPAVTESLGMPSAPSWWRVLVPTGLRLRGWLNNEWQQLQPSRQGSFYSQRPTPSYGDHFTLEQLGSPPLLERYNGQIAEVEYSMNDVKDQK